MRSTAKLAVVVGLGRSGLAAARLLRGEGVEVIGTDSATSEMLSPAVAEMGIQVIAGGHAGVPSSPASRLRDATMEVAVFRIVHSVHTFGGTTATAARS